MNNESTSLETKPYIDIQWLDMHTRFHGLHRGNLLDYFYTSPFFDWQSDNQTVRATLGLTHHSVAGSNIASNEISNALVNMTGIQYSVDELNMREPELFVIKKVRRKSPRVVELVTIYYCLDGVIYQGPNLLDLIHSRIQKGSLYMWRCLEECRRHADFTSDRGHVLWTSPEDVAKTGEVDVVDAERAKSLSGKIVAWEFPSLDSTFRDLIEAKTKSS